MPAPIRPPSTPTSLLHEESPCPFPSPPDNIIPPPPPSMPPVLNSNNNSSSTDQYKGFIAGVFSGIAKLTVGHPFDTIKVRLQTAPQSQFRGPIDCLLLTLRREGIRGLYKGATPPLIGWMFMDSIMLGSLTLYRHLLSRALYPADPADPNHSPSTPRPLSTPAHGLAGLLAGWTVSTIATPIEHIKARLQTQYATRKSLRAYTGPVDCALQLHRTHGLARGLWHGFGATLIFRSFFFVWWAAYDALAKGLRARTRLGEPAVNFWAGGLSAQAFWLAAYPADNVKQRILVGPLGGGGGERYGGRGSRWVRVCGHVWRTEGARGFWRGFVPCALRAFPANAVALVAFEGVLRGL